MERLYESVDSLYETVERTYQDMDSPPLQNCFEMDVQMNYLRQPLC